MGVTVATSLLTLLFGGSAMAEFGTVNDERHDGSNRAEVRSLRVDNGQDDFAAVIGFSAYKPSRATALVILQPVGGRSFYSVGRGADGDDLILAFQRPFEAGVAVECDGLRTRVAKRRTRLRISFPQSCLKDAGALEVSALAEDKSGGDIDGTREVRVRRGERGSGGADA